MQIWEVKSIGIYNQVLSVFVFCMTHWLNVSFLLIRFVQLSRLMDNEGVESANPPQLKILL